MEPMNAVEKDAAELVDPRSLTPVMTYASLFTGDRLYTIPQGQYNTTPYPYRCAVGPHNSLIDNRAHVHL